jgi:hypothetical protein
MRGLDERQRLNELAQMYNCTVDEIKRRLKEVDI